MNKQIIPPWLEDWYRGLIDPVTQWAIRQKIDPNILTAISLGITAVSAVFLYNGHLRVGGVLILLGGTFDILDGAVARATNRSSTFGALWDSALDRYAEFLIFFGLLFYFLHRGLFFHQTAIMAICWALTGSMMVSYVRARAEGLGLECKVGLMQRPERVVLLGFGAIFHESVLTFFIVIIAVFANFTAVQRIHHVWSATRRDV